VKDGNPAWNRTFNNVAIPAMHHYLFNLEKGDAVNKEYDIRYSITVTSSLACAGVAGADCMDWLEYHPANDTIEGIPTALAF